MQTDLELLAELENGVRDAITELERRLGTGTKVDEAEMVLFQIHMEKNLLAMIQVLKNKAFRK